MKKNIAIAIMFALVVWQFIEVTDRNQKITSLQEDVEAYKAYVDLSTVHIQDLENQLAAKYQKQVILTAYVPEKPTTATMTKPVPGWHCAISKALYEEWGLGGKVYAWGYGVHGILDVMPDIYGDEYRIDLMVGTVEEAMKIGKSTVLACLIEG